MTTSKYLKTNHGPLSRYARNRPLLRSPSLNAFQGRFGLEFHLDVAHHLLRQLFF